MEDLASIEDRNKPELVRGWIKEAKARERLFLEDSPDRNSFGAGGYSGAIDVLEELERFLDGEDA